MEVFILYKNLSTLGFVFFLCEETEAEVLQEP